MIINPFTRYPVIVRHLGELNEWRDAAVRMAAALATMAQGVPKMQGAAECYSGADLTALEAITAKLEAVGEAVALEHVLRERAMLALETCIAERARWGDPEDDRPPNDRT